jgi:NhaP-type Na+/H+ or K+/H+ antiporter
LFLCAYVSANEHEAAAHGEHDGGFDNQHEGPHFALLFMFFALTIGAITEYVLSQNWPSFPFTAMMLIEGIAIALIYEASRNCGFVSIHHGNATLVCNDESLGELNSSIRMWSNIDPHLLLYAFVPALLFGDAMALNTHIFFKCLVQCLILAGPGVLFGTAITGICAKYILPYEWDWQLCMVFGSILSATDPVAVVALLKAVGASPTLTMQVTGESLLNDGTAMVVFLLFFNMYKDTDEACIEAYNASPREPCKHEAETYDAGAIIAFFCRLALGGVAVGAAFGGVTVMLIQRASHKTKDTDTTVQILLTICCAYLSFYVGEEICGVSGVLTNVTAALVLAKYGWPSFTDSHSMHVVWHAFESIGNTLIFLLAGLIIGESIWEGHTVAERKEKVITSRDWGYMFLFFVLMTAIRGVMIMLAYPLLKRTGYGTSVKESFFMMWGGLRGAIGLALAMIVKQSINVVDGQRILFFVGCLATCTLVVNGTTSAYVLQKLGLIDSPAEKILLLTITQQRIRAVMERSYTEKSEQPQFEGIRKNVVRKYVSILDPVAALAEDKKMASDLGEIAEPNDEELEERESDGADRKATSAMQDILARRITKRLSNSDKSAMQAIAREVFLQLLNAEYEHIIDSGLVPHKDRAATLLLSSTSVAMDNLRVPLHDWDQLTEMRLTSLERWFPSCFKYVEGTNFVVDAIREVRNPSSSNPEPTPDSENSTSAEPAFRAMNHSGDVLEAQADKDLANESKMLPDVAAFTDSKTQIVLLKDYLHLARQETMFHIAVGYLEGHEHARAKVLQYFDNVDAALQVIKESESECVKAHALLDKIDPILVANLRTKQFAGAMLSEQASYIHKLVHQGAFRYQNL